MRLWRHSREGKSQSEVSLDSKVHACVSSAPEAQRQCVRRQAQIIRKGCFVGREKCRRQVQIATCSGQAGQRVDSTAKLMPYVGIPVEAVVALEKNHKPQRMLTLICLVV